MGTPFRSAIELRLSREFGYAYRIRECIDRDEFASHPAALLSDGVHKVFVKLGEQSFALEQFEAECHGLLMLQQQGLAVVPKVICLLPLELSPLKKGVLQIQTALTLVRRASQQWFEIGVALARLHSSATAPTCGLEFDSYWGDIKIDNRPLPDWPTFYRERRLLPHWRLAQTSGHLPQEIDRRVDALLRRYDQLSGDAIQPCLLHGDAHANNFLSTPQGAAMIDPAVHYGSPEYDLAFVDFFTPVPNDVFEGYRSIRAISAGFFERRDLWQIAAWLAVVALDGPKWLPQLIRCIDAYQ